MVVNTEQVVLYYTDTIFIIVIYNLAYFKSVPGFGLNTASPWVPELCAYPDAPTGKLRPSGTLRPR